MRAHVVFAYLGVGLVVIASLGALPADPGAGSLLYGVIGIAAGIAVVRGTRRQLGNGAGGWHLIAAGILALTVGHLLEALFATRLADTGLTPADFLRLGGYVLAAVGVVRIQGAGPPETLGARALESALVTLGSGLLTWQVALGPALDRPGLEPAERTLTLIYPLVALGVVAVAAWCGVVLRRATTSQVMLGLGLLLLLTGEIVAAAEPQVVAAAMSRMTGLLLLGAAALHPSAALPGGPQPSFGRFHLGVLGIAALSGPAVVALQAWSFGVRAILPAAVSSAGLLLLLLTRTRFLVRRHEGVKVALQRTASDLRATETDRRRLLAETIRAGERQRAEIAYELHDGPIQRLSAIGYTLDRAAIAMRRDDPKEERALLEKATDSLRHEIGSLRALMVALRPPALDEQGLEDALRDQASAFTRQTGIPCVIQSELRERLASDLEVLLYRVSQEALRNVAKHAQASRASVNLGIANGSVQLEVRDDGVGFDLRRIQHVTHDGHVGLMSMREQVEMAGGTWRIDSRPDVGTRIQATIPRRTG